MLGGPHLGRYDPIAAVERVLHGIDDRHRTVLEQRALALSRRRTLAEIGDGLGVTRERVRQSNGRRHAVCPKCSDVPRMTPCGEALRGFVTRLELQRPFGQSWTPRS